ncbi:hypothetical protein EYF80_011048 [Liparis tanakae]|uniref:Uncharacterized protein n=1 Tax=Liparis tanakae TaxID=230148 RepID=A0A4Z2IMD5_9TELE|nr:hypothetical protein EYF80_011048 [Liparis tanakae]
MSCLEEEEETYSASSYRNLQLRLLSVTMNSCSWSLRKPLKMGTRSAAVSWSPRITASSWMENASVRRTFH